MSNNAQRRVIDPILSTVVQGYQHPEHVGMALFPRVTVRVAGGKVIEFGRESFKLYNTARAPGGAVKRMQFGYEGKPYAVENHALDALVPREHLREAEQVPSISLATEATTDVMAVMSLYLEYQQATLARDANNYQAANKIALAGSDRLNDYADSDPIDVIETGRSAVRTKVGLYPNTLLMGAPVFDKLKHHPVILDKIKYTQTGVLTEELLASIFSIPRVVVGKAVAVDDAGVQSDIWGKDMILAYVPTVITGVRQPSYGYTYTMDGHPLVESPEWDSTHRSWVYGMSYERAPVLSGIESGYLIQTAVD
jgi:hypothetical protein